VIPLLLAALVSEQRSDPVILQRVEGVPASSVTAVYSARCPGSSDYVLRLRSSPTPSVEGLSGGTRAISASDSRLFDSWLVGMRTVRSVQMDCNPRGPILYLAGPATDQPSRTIELNVAWIEGRLIRLP